MSDKPTNPPQVITDERVTEMMIEAGRVAETSWQAAPDYFAEVYLAMRAHDPEITALRSKLNERTEVLREAKDYVWSFYFDPRAPLLIDKIDATLTEGS